MLAFEKFPFQGVFARFIFVRILVLIDTLIERHSRVTPSECEMRFGTKVTIVTYSMGDTK